MNIYLAGPIDLAVAGQDTWKTRLADKLVSIEKADKSVQYTAYDPAKPWMLMNDLVHQKSRTEFIEKVNTTAIACSKVVVAHVPSNVVSIGTPIEINDAWKQHIDVIVLSDIPYGKNGYLTNRVNRDKYVTYSGSISDADIEDVVYKIISIATTRTGQGRFYSTPKSETRNDAKV